MVRIPRNTTGRRSDVITTRPFSRRDPFARRLGFERTWQAQEHRRVPQLISTIDQELADNLAFLRKYRNAADYDLELSRETASIQAAQSAAIAVRIIARLDALTAGNRQS